MTAIRQLQLASFPILFPVSRQSFPSQGEWSGIDILQQQQQQ